MEYPQKFIDKVRKHIPELSDEAENGNFFLGKLLWDGVLDKNEHYRKFAEEWCGLSCVLDVVTSMYVRT